MNDTSKYLHRFLEPLKEIPAFSFSEKSARVIKTLYDYLLESDQAWRQGHPIEPLNPSFSPEVGNFNYIPKEIRAGLDQCKGFQTTFYFPRRTFHIYMFLTTPKQCEKYIRKIFMWLYIAEKYAHNKCSRVAHLYFYMTNHLKTLPDTQIQMVHVNTAFTLPCSENTYMYLFRSEEWFKVFIHETFHNLGLDFSSMDQALAEKRVLSRFPLSISDIRIFETYCEVWAETINTLFVSYEITRSRGTLKNKPRKTRKTPFSKIRRKMESLLGTERMFSVFQCVKVLNHYGLTYDDIYKTNTHSAKAVLRYREKTNVFSYYVLKTILFYHLNSFLEWCVENNENVLNFRKTQATLAKYVKLIEGLYADPKYTSLLQSVTHWYKEVEDDSFAFKTLRMTSTESA